MNRKSTRKVEDSERDTLRPEYRQEELGKGVRGKYFKQFAEGTIFVLLSHDIPKEFPTAESVNAALRSLLQVAKRATATNKALLPTRYK